MDIKEMIKNRHSVRQYKDIPIEDELRMQLDELARECNEESGLNIQVIYDDPECFDTLIAHYGKFENVRNYIALVGDKSMENLDELCGYYGQKIVIAAQGMGLNTCWVGGSYGKGKCKADKDKMRELIRNERRLELCFEGFRFWDLRRWKANLNETAKGVSITVVEGKPQYEYFDVETRNYKENAYYGPIPYNDVLNFPSLVQNAGW